MLPIVAEKEKNIMLKLIKTETNKPTETIIVSKFNDIRILAPFLITTINDYLTDAIGSSCAINDMKPSETSKIGSITIERTSETKYTLTHKTPKKVVTFAIKECYKPGETFFIPTTDATKKLKHIFDYMFIDSNTLLIQTRHKEKISNYGMFTPTYNAFKFHKSNNQKYCVFFNADDPTIPFLSVEIQSRCNFDILNMTIIAQYEMIQNLANEIINEYYDIYPD